MLNRGEISVNFRDQGMLIYSRLTDEFIPTAIPSIVPTRSIAGTVESANGVRVRWWSSLFC
jgi:hypothetical protein